MPLSRGLMISLGVSALGCTLLFLYFRHRITAVENKVNVMFDLIQTHQTGTSDQYYSQNEAQQQTNVNDPNDDTSESQQDNAMNKNTLIEVSDNEDDDEQYHSDDSMSVTDAEDSEDDERKTISLAGAEQISLKQEDIKKIIVPLTTTSQSADAISLPELEELQDSLDELDDDEETSGEEDTVLTDNVGGNACKISVVKSDDPDTVEPFDYNKLKVTELKAMADAKGLTNYKKLKKAPLIALLKENETNE